MSDENGGETFREDSGHSGGAGSTYREAAGPSPAAGFVSVALLPCLSDRFTVVADLQGGGEANVLLVRDDAGRRWVVKQYRRPGWAPSPDVLDRLADARAEHDLESWSRDPSTRGVVWLQDSGLDPATGLFYEVMEHLSGGLLAERKGDWRADDLGRALGETVAAFHNLVGAHRDIKPSNLMQRSDGDRVLVLVDLGLAREVSEQSQRLSKREGSAAYQAPEAAQGLVSRAGDWWSVGMVLAEHALGFHPFARGDGSLLPDQVIQAELAQRGVPNLDAIEDERVQLLCRGLLTRDSRKRWRHAEVKAWLRGESPTVAEPGGDGDVVPAGPHRRRTVLFKGVDYDSPRGLAAGLAADPRTAGSILFERRDPVLWEDLRMLLQSRGQFDAQAILESYRSGPWGGHLLRLLAELDQELPPVLAGQSLTPAAMGMLAQEVLQAGRASDAQRAALAWVTDHDAWRIWRALPGMEDAPRADDGRPKEPLFHALDGELVILDSGNVAWRNDAASRQRGDVVLFDQSAVAGFGARVAGAAQAWAVLWGIDPEAVRSRIQTMLFPQIEEMQEQRWWVDNATRPDPGLLIAAAVYSPLAATAHEEFARIMHSRSLGLAKQQRRDEILGAKAPERERIERELAKHRKRGIFPWNEGIVRDLDRRLALLYPWDDPAYAWSDGARDWVRVN